MHPSSISSDVAHDARRHRLREALAYVLSVSVIGYAYARELAPVAGFRFDDAYITLRYAREMYLNPERVDAAFYDEGRRHYSEAQIMELGAFIAFHYGMQAFARTLGLAPLIQRQA